VGPATQSTWVERLKSTAVDVDPSRVQFERLMIEARDTTFTLELDPRMTVIAGVGTLEREGLVNELVGALGPGRSGVHLDLVTDAGTRYRVMRPSEGAARVIDVDRDRDVTDAFRDDRGAVDVLAQVGSSPAEAKRLMRLTASDLTTRTEREQRLLALARIDQTRLWDVADKVREREAALAAIAAETGSGPEDSRLLAEIERRHEAFEQAQERAERVRHLSFVVGASAALSVLPLTVVAGIAATVPALLVAAGMTAHSLRWWRRAERARADEAAALRAAGATSYLAFSINRVNGLLSDDQQRRRMVQAADYHRAALAEWHVLAGEIPVDWAIEHRDEVREAAVRLRDTVGVRNPMALTMTPREEATAELAHTLLRRLEQLERLGSGTESFPLLVDDPFGEVDPAVTGDLLDLLVRASAKQQVVVLTENAEVAAWARREAARGSLRLIEPAADAPERSGSHVAA
jgi:hypothetical protein